MNKDDITISVMSTFRRSIEQDKQISSILAKVKAGKATQRDIATYADLLGKHASDAFNKYVDYKNFSDSAVKGAIKKALNSNYLSINGQAALELRAEDKRKGLNIAIKKQKDFRTDEYLKRLEAATEEAFKTELVEGAKTTARQYYDDFQKSNVELREKLGYDEVVIRVYDDVGLRNRTQPCQFCMERAGEYKYSEAKSLGIFQRHEGCGCHIEISTPEWTRDQKEWKTNTWTDR